MRAIETPKIRVMLVSEFPIFVWGLKRFIEEQPQSMSLVGLAGTLAEAVNVLKAALPEVLLLDADGQHGAEAIRELLAVAPTRILAMTASREAAVLDRLVLAGANGIFNMTEPTLVLTKAIERIHQGEIWLDRLTTGRVFVELARKSARQGRDPEAEKFATLTRKERATVEEIARDASATPKAIAARLHISEYTLRNHLTSIYAKLGVANRLELYAYAIKHGRS